MILLLSQELSRFEGGITFSNCLYKELWKGSESSVVQSKVIPNNSGLGKAFVNLIKINQDVPSTICLSIL